MTKIQKTLLLPALLLFALTACGTQYLSYQTETYSLEYPPSWKKFDNVSGNLGDLDLVLMQIDQDDEVKASLSIIADDELVKTDEIKTYIENDIKPFANMEGYKEFDLENFEVSGNKTLLHSFVALDEKDLEKEFLQTYVTSEKNLYVITASLPVDPDSSLLAEVKRIMRSFQLQVSSEA